jgi:transcriptional regulator with XRE-family HTH domain
MVDDPNPSDRLPVAQKASRQPSGRPKRATSTTKTVEGKTPRPQPPLETRLAFQRSADVFEWRVKRSHHLPDSLGSAVRELRARQELAQQDVAQAIGASGGHLSRIENDFHVPRRDRFTELVEFLTDNEFERTDLRALRDVAEIQSRLDLPLAVAWLAVALAAEPQDQPRVKDALRALDPHQMMLLKASLMMLEHEQAT